MGEQKSSKSFRKTMKSRVHLGEAEKAGPKFQSFTDVCCMEIYLDFFLGN